MNAPKQPASKGVGGRPDVTMAPTIDQVAQNWWNEYGYGPAWDRGVKRLHMEKNRVDWTFALSKFFVAYTIQL